MRHGGSKNLFAFFLVVGRRRNFVAYLNSGRNFARLPVLLLFASVCCCYSSPRIKYTYTTNPPSFGRGIRHRQRADALIRGGGDGVAWWVERKAQMNFNYCNNTDNKPCANNNI